MIRDEIVVSARAWIGTPYRHQASRRGVGADCLGLIRGVWREVVGDEPQVPPPYTPDWTEALKEETLLKAARSYLEELPVSNADAGDVYLFRMGLGHPAKHCAILSGGDPHWLCARTEALYTACGLERRYDPGAHSGLEIDRAALAKALAEPLDRLINSGA